MEETRKIVMAVTTDYVSDPRVMRSSMTLGEAGFEVKVVARRKRGAKQILDGEIEEKKECECGLDSFLRKMDQAAMQYLVSQAEKTAQ